MSNGCGIGRRHVLLGLATGLTAPTILTLLDRNVALAADGSLSVALPSNPATFDPCNQTNHDAMVLSQLIFENLYEVDVNGVPQPMLAVSHKISDDGLTWWFDLRDDVYFQNSQKMTAEDVKYSYEWVLDENNKAARRAIWTRIKRIEVESPTRVRFEMNRPYGSMLLYMTKYMGIFPKGSRENPGTAAFQSNPVGLGTGPGIFVSAQKNDYVEFKRNPNYWRKGVPAWNKLTVQIVPEDSVRVAYLMTDKVQIISAPPPREYTRLKSLPGIGGASKIAIGSRMFISMNNAKAPFDDVNFRLAISRGIDRQKIASQLFGLLDPTAIPAPTDSWWFNKEANARLDFNLDAAKELLAKSKYPTGASFDLLLPAEPYLVDVKDAALLVQADLKKNLGITANLQVLETSQVIGDMIKGAHTAAIVVFMTPPDPIVQDFYTGNILAKGVGYENKAFNDAVDKYFASKTQEEKKAVLDQLYGILAQDCPNVYLGVAHASNLWRSAVKGFEVNTGITMRLRSAVPSA